MSEQYTTLEESPGMLKAFAAAGLEPDVDANTGDDTQSETAKNGSDTQSGDTSSGTNSTDTISGGAGKDSLSGKLDGGKKSTKEEKGKDTSDPNDLKLTDGTVIKAGPERRWYEDGRIAKQKLGIAESNVTRLNGELGTLKTKYDTLEATVKSIGLEDPAQVSSAVKLYKDLARDLPGTMQKLLAEAKAMGHTFEGVGGSIDTAAISNLIDARMPKASQEQKQPTREEIDAQSTKDVQEFVTQFPDAVTHEAHIAALIDRSVEIGKPISLTDAYFLLKERVVADGFDWAKPIGPQVEARKQTQAKTETKPRTGGRSVIERTPVDPNEIIQPERELDSDSIVSAAMRENGLNPGR